MQVAIVALRAIVQAMPRCLPACLGLRQGCLTPWHTPKVISSRCSAGVGIFQGSNAQPVSAYSKATMHIATMPCLQSSKPRCSPTCHGLASRLLGQCQGTLQRHPTDVVLPFGRNRLCITSWHTLSCTMHMSSNYVRLLIYALYVGSPPLAHRLTCAPIER